MAKNNELEQLRERLIDRATKRIEKEEDPGKRQAIKELRDILKQGQEDEDQ